MNAIPGPLMLVCSLLGRLSIGIVGILEASNKVYHKVAVVKFIGRYGGEE